MKLTKNGLPIEPGIYFITSGVKEYWEGVVRVMGQYPFFDVMLLSRTAKTTDVPNVCESTQKLNNPSDYTYSECLEIKL